ncbi:hypothetical protein [Microvirga tunisiensis]|uniref:Alkaline proteinase inhibitor/ Outer membrane lipoprotein Omp19 domain-containing protein n=1 Tax=Microvirga tunisiensis TaxID=2108360 RepID=A0A5N7MIW2_9HYPH|nr:hypothetical protein [Microvirga tunisiensis]MPR08849.1 hypothetical protein [Microvirga tunisiensis]MPR27032.1 hypothetical protein [Microvirga tunisiensis]
MRFAQLSVAAALVISCVFPALAQQSAPPGYKLKPTLSYENVSKDPDGIWPDDELMPSGMRNEYPDISTARISLPSGEWILSVQNGGCSMQSDCPYILALKKNGQITRMSRGYLGGNGTATLSMDYSKLFVDTFSGVETQPVGPTE